MVIGQQPERIVPLSLLPLLAQSGSLNIITKNPYYTEARGAGEAVCLWDTALGGKADLEINQLTLEVQWNLDIQLSTPTSHHPPSPPQLLKGLRNQGSRQEF